MRTPDLAFQSVGVAGFEPTASSSRTAGMAVDRGCFRTSRATVGHLGAVLVGVVAVLRCCTAMDVRRSGASATSGSEWQCFVQLWPPWGMRRVSKTFPKVKSIIDLGEEVR